MRTPDFLIVGAARSGTTALHRLLLQHPQVFLPSVKEPCFFAFADRKAEYRGSKFAFAVKDWNSYCRLFKAVPDSVVAGEASTPYLYLYRESIDAMKRYLPDYSKTKIVILLRHPVERAYSNYIWRVRDGREDLTFEEALALEEERKNDGYSFDYFYAGRSYYFEGVKAYLECFDNVHVILYDDFVARTDEVMAALCRFLAVEEKFRFRQVREVNSSYLPRFPFLSRLVTAELSWKFRVLNALPPVVTDTLRKMFYHFNGKNGKSLVLSKKLRSELAARFRPDVEQLAALIGRDLSSWYE